jgi:hypothetical protein
MSPLGAAISPDVFVIQGQACSGQKGVAVKFTGENMGNFDLNKVTI